MRRRQWLLAAGALAASHLSRAQPARGAARVGVLSAYGLPPTIWDPLIEALRRRGWDGPRIAFEHRPTGSDPARAVAASRELVASRVDLILAFATMTAVAAKQATSSVPIVTWCGYPVEAGLATSLAQPGGNVTGIANYANAEVWGKFPELLRELQPDVRDFAVLWDYVPPAFPDGPIAFVEIEQAARRMGMRSTAWRLSGDADMAEALAALEASTLRSAMLTSGGVIIQQKTWSERLAQVMQRQRIAAITDIASGTFYNTGCVLAYSPSVPHVADRLAYFVDRVLRGAKPASLPFELPARFVLVVSRKAADAIDLKLPSSLLARADHVIG